MTPQLNLNKPDQQFLRALKIDPQDRIPFDAVAASAMVQVHRDREVELCRALDAQFRDTVHWKGAAIAWRRKAMLSVPVVAVCVVVTIGVLLFR